RDVINLASNNYLGLANHPRVNEAASRAAAELGAGSGAVRTIAGQMTMHRELETRFAAFKHADAALMFQSGFTSNAGTVAAILTKDDVIVSDRLNHASIIDGARLSRAEIAVFEHRDADHADRLLVETAKPGRRQLLISDGVFSMDGDIAPLPDLVEVAERRGAVMMVDDAHATGVLGPGGAGSVEHFGLRGRVDVQVGTLSKAIGVLGGFIAGPPHLVEWLENRGRPYLFSTSAPPAVVAACIAALDVIDEEPDRLARLWSNTELLKNGLRELGFDTGASETPITPVITGDEERTQVFARRLFDEGVFCPAIVFPTVGRGAARVRAIVSADHTEDDLREALAVFATVGSEVGLR
ncbi:MAG TPA: aminotransferase class I/II-fold pyridoxal phosphate-dependent enzyme, partial [Actinomycetota bacterium]